jgi:hypothetical protein
MSRTLPSIALWLVASLLPFATAQGQPPVLAPAGPKAALAPNLAHLNSLLVPVKIGDSTFTGVAIYAQADSKDPNKYVVRDAPGEGLVDLDDFGRAVVVYLQDHAVTGRAESLATARKLLDLTLRLQASDGEFYNFVFADGRINTDGPTSRKSAGFWAARGVWALAEGVRAFSQPDPAYARTLEEALQRAVAAFSRKVKPNYGQYRDVLGRRVPSWLPDDGSDVASILAVGLARYLGSRPNDADARTLLGQLAEGIAAYQPGKESDFPFLLHLPDERDPNAWHAWGSRQVQALALASKVLAKPEFLQSARNAAGHAIVHLIAGRGPVEALTPAPDLYPQIAYGMESLASGLYAIEEVTGEKIWSELGGLLTNWLLGDNEGRQAMYDPASGRTFDGLERGIYNSNSGAESTITALLALQAAASRPAAREQLGLTRLERNPDLVLEAENGLDFGAPPPSTADARASNGRLASLEPGASLAISTDTPGGKYLAIVIGRAAPGAGKATLFAGRARVGEISLDAPGSLRLEARTVGRLELPAGKSSLTLSNSGQRPLQLDAVWLLPAIESKTLGAPGRRLRLLKSWSDQPQQTPSVTGATTRAFDRLGKPQTETTIPPYGFAIQTWASDAPLTVAPEGGRTAERHEVKAATVLERYSLLDLTPALNLDAFSTSTEPLRGNLDNLNGPRGATFPAERSPAAGSVLTVAAIPYRFPRSDQKANTIRLYGQTLDIPPGRYAALHVLGTSIQGSYSQTLRLTYASGPEGTVPFGLSDWCQAPRFGEAIAVNYPLRRGNNGSLEPTECHIYAATVRLDPNRELRGITLPDRETMHLFAITVEKAP